MDSKPLDDSNVFQHFSSQLPAKDARVQELEHTVSALQERLSIEKEAVFTLALEMDKMNTENGAATAAVTSLEQRLAVEKETVFALALEMQGLRTE
eukprot:3936610-Rhodomonas_salina.2